LFVNPGNLSGVVFAVIGNGFKGWAQSAEQPNDLDIALRFDFKLAGGVNALDVSIDIEFDQGGSRIATPPRGVLRGQMVKLLRVFFDNTVNQPIQQANRVVRGDQIVQGVHKGKLVAVSWDNGRHKPMILSN